MRRTICALLAGLTLLAWAPALAQGMETSDRYVSNGRVILRDRLADIWTDGVKTLPQGWAVAWDQAGRTVVLAGEG